MICLLSASNGRQTVLPKVRAAVEGVVEEEREKGDLGLLGLMADCGRDAGGKNVGLQLVAGFSGDDRERGK